MIIRGTTPVHTYDIPFSTDTIEEIYITYVQNDKIILDKTTEDIILEPDAHFVDLKLTQEETLLFTYDEEHIENNIVEIQVRTLDKHGDAYASRIIKERVYEILRDGVIANV